MARDLREAFLCYRCKVSLVCIPSSLMVGATLPADMMMESDEDKVEGGKMAEKKFGREL